MEKEELRNMILKNKRRIDGRGPEDIREIWTETGYFPRAHGSAIFTRGETQALVSVTLGTKRDAQSIEIGRASCRERVEMTEEGGRWKKKRSKGENTSM